MCWATSTRRGSSRTSLGRRSRTTPIPACCRTGSRPSTPGCASGRVLALTPAELRVVTLLPSHLSLQEIGARISLSRATVKTHTVAIYRKLAVSGRSEAVERLEALGFFGAAPQPPSSG